MTVRGPSRRPYRGRRGFGGRLGLIGAVLLVILAAARIWRGETDPTGAAAPAFDHYVAALSWSPSFCQENPDRAQCAERHGFILHGLWPQYADGQWPETCETGFVGPDKRTVAAGLAATPDKGLIQHQWRKHGTCSGLSANAYVEAGLKAFEKIQKPDLPPPGARSMSPKAIERAFLALNPGFPPDGVTVTCRNGRLQEVRLCLTKGLEPRPCAGRTARDCQAGAVEVPPPG